MYVQFVHIKNILPPPKNSQKVVDKLFRPFLLFFYTFLQKALPAELLEENFWSFRKKRSKQLKITDHKSNLKKLLFSRFLNYFQNISKAFPPEHIFFRKNTFQSVIALQAIWNSDDFVYLPVTMILSKCKRTAKKT